MADLKSNTIPSFSKWSPTHKKVPTEELQSNFQLKILNYFKSVEWKECEDKRSKKDE